MSDQPNLDTRVATLEEIARTTVGALSRIEANQARFDSSLTEMRVALMERMERLEDKLTQILDQVAIHSMATETVRRTQDEHRAEMEAQRNALASQRKAISTVEEQILLLQRQIMRLDAQMSELRGG